MVTDSGNYLRGNRVMLGGDDGWGGGGPADEGTFKVSAKDENEPTL